MKNTDYDFFLISLGEKTSAEIDVEDLRKYSKFFSSWDDERRAKVIPFSVRGKVANAMERELEKVNGLLAEVKGPIEWPTGGQIWHQKKEG